MKNLLGVVLCGGKSKRMGSDKGLMTNYGKTWVETVAGKLLSLKMPVVVSINALQRESYTEIFSPEDLVVDSVDINGPLKGLLSVHEKYPEQDILLMACDLIEMDELTLINLIGHYQSQSAFDFFAYHEDFAEPFCAIYTSRGLKPILEKAEHHSLLKFSFQNILNEGKTMWIPLINRAPFRNYNTIPGHHQPPDSIN